MKLQYYIVVDVVTHNIHCLLIHGILMSFHIESMFIVRNYFPSQNFGQSKSQLVSKYLVMHPIIKRLEGFLSEEFSFGNVNEIRLANL